MSFRLSPEITLPSSAATSTFAFLGTRGSGKTYGAGVLVEEFLGARVQVVVVDPVGVWWALRLAADGVGRGFDIPVFGGIHGDIPLEPTAGELVAHLVVEQRVSLVLDVSDFTDGQQRRFVEAFSRTFFQLKKRSKSPTHLVFEEAHEFFPQVVDGASAPMVGATKRLWKVGRNYGIGGSLISTRAAEINKNALNISDRIITGRMTAPEDVKRIKDWASSNGVNAEQVAELTSMPKGKLIVWRDAHEGGAVMTTFRAKTTFDASRTPEAGDAQPAAGLARAWKDDDDGGLTLPSESVLLIGLNPSFADAEKPDHTITVEVNFAHAWGFMAMFKMNLFDWISTDPDALAGVDNPEGDPKNLDAILDQAERVAKIVCCWGDGGTLRGRAAYVRGALEPHRKKLFCLGYTKEGQPRHTSRLPYAAKLVPMWKGA